MLDLERVAKLLPDNKWIPEDEAITRLARGMKLPVHERSIARGMLQSSLGGFGLAERRGTPGRFEWRRCKPPQIPAKKPPRVMFHRDPVVVGGVPQIKTFEPEPWPLAPPVVATP